MAAALKILELLEENDAFVYQVLNEKTARFCERLNTFFLQNSYPIAVSYFASLFRFTTPGKTNLLYNYLMLNGVYVWEGRNCFLSPSHSDAVINRLQKIIEHSCFEMEQDGLLVRKSKP